MFSVSNTQKWNPPAKLDILHPYLYGTNVGGATQTMAQLPFNNGTNGKWLTQADVNYLVSKNMNCVRLMISQETLQSNVSSNNVPFSDFHPANWTAFKNQIDMLIAANFYIVLARHQGADQYFGQYNGIALNGHGGSNSGSILADFWRRMVELLGPTNPNIGYSIDNEPLLGSGPGGWWDVAQTCINAIRRAGSGQTIFVPGISYSGASQWSSVPWNDPNSGGIRNSVGFLQLQDPCDNLVAELHCYFSAEDSGSVTGNVASPTIGRDRLANVVAWANTNNKRFFIGEWGSQAGVTNSAENAADYNNYMRSLASINNGKCVGSCWWVFASYPWFNGYEYTLTPTNSALTADSAQMDMLEAINYFSDATATPIFNPLTDVPGIYARYRPEDYNSGTGIWPNTGASTSDTTRDLQIISGSGTYATTADYSASDSLLNNQPSIGCTNTTSSRRVGFRSRGNVDLVSPITGACTIYMIMIVTKGGTVYWSKNRAMAGDNGSGSIRINTFNGIQASRNGATNSITTTSAAVTTNTSHVVCIVFDGASSATYVNSNTAAVTGNTGTTTISSLGMGNTSTDAAWLWRVGDYYIYSAAHTGTERANMMTFLGTKYGKTIA